MTTHATQIASNRRVLELDGIRGLAILLVVIWHYVGQFIVVYVPLPTAIINSVSTTWSGVDLFFVLSGYLIGGILMDNRQATNYFQTFYIRRFARILPIYWVWIILFLILPPLTHPILQPAIHNDLFQSNVPTPALFLFLQNFVMAITNTWGPQWITMTWSLAVEEQFYLLLPAMIRFIPPKKLPYVLLAFIVAAPLLRIVMLNRFGLAAPYVLMPCRADALMAGVLCAFAVRQPAMVLALRKVRRWFYAMLALLSMGALTLTAQGLTHLATRQIDFGYTLFALLYACLLLMTVLGISPSLGAFFRLPALRYFGKLAYGIYLFHIGLLHLVFGLLVGALHGITDDRWYIAVALATFVLTISIAQLSWTYFEKKFVKLSHRVNYTHQLDTIEGMITE
jgi:peptidoglycan/LPS O-acetylase OafA/YrhL